MGYTTSGSGNNDTTVHSEYRGYDYSASNDYLVADVDYISRYDRWSMEGVELPNFFRRMRAGELLPHTAYRKTIQTGYASGDYSNTYKNDDRRYCTNGRVYYDPTVNQGHIDKAWELCPIDPKMLVQSCAASLYSQGWDTLTFAAELNKTIAMFKDAKKSLINLLRLKNPLRSWLEYRYGWRILVYDLIEIDKALASLGKSKRTRFSQRVGQSVSYTWDDTRILLDWSSCDWYQNYSYNVELSLRGSVTADISPPTFQFNPAVTGWEILTFSFIIDWFYRVGPWLEAMSFLVISDNYAASWGSKMIITRNGWADDVVKHPDWDALELNQNSTCVLTEVLRVPSSVSKTPYVSVNLDGFKITDLVAIASGFLTDDRSRKTLRL